MTSEDRELLQALRRQQQDLQRSLARLDVQLGELEARAGETIPEQPEAAPLELHLPPLPTEHLPPLPLHEEATAALPPLPPTPPPVRTPKPAFEFQVGKWLTKIGAVCFVLSIVFFAIWADVSYHIHERLGPQGKLGIMGLISATLIFLGQRLERKNAGMIFYGRTLMAAGLGGLYFTFYAAHYLENLRVIANPFLAGVLLLLWSAYVFSLAERRKSQTLGIFAILLAYFSSAINSIGAFTMGPDLILAATAVIFLIRNGWATLSYLSLVGTYFALLRRLVADENGEIVLDTSRTLHFWPYAVYLIGAWSIFTFAVIIGAAPTFRGGKRLAFLSLNNGAFAGLLALTTYISGYDYGSVGSSLLWTGFAFLVTSRFAGWVQIEAADVMAAYAAQGLALVTGGIIVVYTGITRGVLLMLETLFLGAAGAFSADIILIATAHVAALFATLFLMLEITVYAHHPWLLGVGGAVVLYINAWWARAEIRYSPQSLNTVVLSTSYFCTLALGLIYTTMSVELSDAALPPALALVALGITFSIYLVSLYELPPLAQTFLLSAQALVLFPAETGEELPWWSTAVVAAVTLLMITWWTRQRITRKGLWIVVLNLVYALALVGLTYHAVRPWVDAQDWMCLAAILSAAFLAFGAITRVWPIAVMGQLFLAVSVYHFFVPPGEWDLHSFIWDWCAAAVPIVVLYASAHATHVWLRLSPEVHEIRRTFLRALAYGYQLLALLMLARLLFAVLAAPDLIAAFLFLGTLLLAWNVRQASAFGVRCSFVLTALGFVLYLHRFQDQSLTMATFLNGLAMLAFLFQPALLRLGKSMLVSEFESWSFILLSVGTTWLFVSAWIVLRVHPSYLSMSWALYGLFLFIFGLLVRERRQRWCGLAIVLVAIVRVFSFDFWGFSNGYRVLTFIVLTIVTLGLGFIYARFADRLKTWL